MPRYRLILHGDKRSYQDPVGFYFADHEAALAHAHRVLSELNRDDFDGAGLTMAMQDEGAHPLFHSFLEDLRRGARGVRSPCHAPTNLAGRFSKKAFTPSRKSAVAPARRCERHSRSSCCS